MHEDQTKTSIDEFTSSILDLIEATDDNEDSTSSEDEEEC